MTHLTVVAPASPFPNQHQNQRQQRHLATKTAKRRSNCVRAAPCPFQAPIRPRRRPRIFWVGWRRSGATWFGSTTRFLWGNWRSLPRNSKMATRCYIFSGRFIYPYDNIWYILHIHVFDKLFLDLFCRKYVSLLNNSFIIVKNRRSPITLARNSIPTLLHAHLAT